MAFRTCLEPLQGRKKAREGWVSRGLARSTGVPRGIWAACDVLPGVACLEETHYVRVRRCISVVVCCVHFAEYCRAHTRKLSLVMDGVEGRAQTRGRPRNGGCFLIWGNMWSVRRLSQLHVTGRRFRGSVQISVTDCDDLPPTVTPCDAVHIPFRQRRPRCRRPQQQRPPAERTPLSPLTPSGSSRAKMSAPGSSSRPK